MRGASRTALIEWADRRLTAIRDERAKRIEGVANGGSADAIMFVGRDVAQYDAVDRELTMFLRVAHGMNPNGRWPHPANTCVGCGKLGVDLFAPCAYCDRNREVVPNAE